MHEDPFASPDHDARTSAVGDHGVWSLVLIAMSIYCGVTALVGVPLGLYAWYRARSVRHLDLSEADRLRSRLSTIAGVLSLLHALLWMVAMALFVAFSALVLAEIASEDDVSVEFVPAHDGPPPGDEPAEAPDDATD